MISIRSISIVIILYLSLQVKCEQVVNIGYIDFTSIYTGAPNEHILRAAIPAASGEVRRAAQIFEEYTKRHNHKVNGEKVVFNLVIEESDYSQESTFGAVCNLLNQGIKYLIAPFGTGPGLQVADIIDRNLCELDDPGAIIQISGSTQERTFSHKKTATFSTMPTIHRMLSEIIPYFRGKAHNVTFVKTLGTRPGDPAISTCDNLEEEFFKSGIIPHKEVVWFDNSFDLSKKYHYEQVVDEIMEIDSDMMIYCGIDKNIMDIIATIFMEKNYTPKGVITTANEFHVNETMTNFWTVTSSAVRSEFQFEEIDFFQTEDEYIQLYIDLFPEEFSDNYKMGLFTVFACEIYLKSMQNRNTVTDSNQVLDGIIKGRFNTLLGEIYYSVNHENQNSGISLQKTPQYMNIIGPYQVSNTTIIYPIPTWKEREYREEYHTIEIITMVLALVMIINILIIGLLITLKQKQTKEMIFMLLGGLLLSILVILWSPIHLTTTTCVTIPILIILGLLFIVGAITFQFGKLNYDKKTFMIILSLILLSEIVIFIFWNIFSRVEVDRNIIDAFRPYKNNAYCKIGKLQGLFIGLSSLPLLGIYLFGIFLTIRTIIKKITSNIAFKYYAFALYNVAVCSIIVIILENVGISGNIFAQQILRSVLILISIAVTVNIIPIIIKIENKKLMRQISTSSFTRNSRSMTISHDSEFYKSKQEIYRKKCIELETEVKEMEILRNDLKQQLAEKET